MKTELNSTMMSDINNNNMKNLNHHSNHNAVTNR